MGDMKIIIDAAISKGIITKAEIVEFSKDLEGYSTLGCGNKPRQGNDLFQYIMSDVYLNGEMRIPGIAPYTSEGKPRPPVTPALLDALVKCWCASKFK